MIAQSVCGDHRKRHHSKLLEQIDVWKISLIQSLFDEVLSTKEFLQAVVFRVLFEVLAQFSTLLFQIIGHLIVDLLE